MTNEIFDPNGQQSSGVIRQYTNTGVSGIIPKLRINHFEIAAGTDGIATKEQCKFHLDSIIKGFSDQARTGNKVEAQIPHVGKLTIKNGVAGVVFD